MESLKRLSALIGLMLITNSMIHCSIMSQNNYCVKNKGEICQGKLAYNCMEDKCAINGSACDHLIGLDFYFNLFANKNLHQKRFEKYKTFKSKLNLCPYYKFHTDAICSNVKCANAILSGTAKSKNTECLYCTGSHSYTCGKFVCSKNKKECDSFKSKLNVTKKDPIMLKSCEAVKKGWKIKMNKNICSSKII